jgi:hypothetical protein
MVSTLFTALALIATGQAQVPPAATQPALTRDMRDCEAGDEAEADTDRQRD